MKKILLLLCSVLLVLGMSGMAGATVYTTNGLNSLDHYYWYKWGINETIPDGETITSASLFFDNIYNWQNESNDLWVHLLDSVALGVTSGTDTYNPDYTRTDQFAGQGVELLHWVNIPAYAQDLTYTFDTSQIAALGNYIGNDGNFGFGLDPDCHFYTSGVSFTVETSGAPVPEPTTMLLLGCGLAGLGFVRKKRQKA